MQGRQRCRSLTVYIMTVTLTLGPNHCFNKEKAEPQKCQALLFLRSVPLLLPQEQGWLRLWAQVLGLPCPAQHMLELSPNPR